MDNVGAKKPGGYALRQLTWRDMLSPLFRKRRVVVATFCLIFGIALFTAWGWANHYYVAAMQVVVARERTDPTVTGQQNAVAGNNTTVTADEVASEIALLQGRDMLKQVAETCGLTKETPSVFDFLKKLDAPDPAVKRAEVLERATKGLAANLRVEAQKSSHVIDVQYGRAGAPETPACVLQTLGNLYLEKHLRLQRPAERSIFLPPRRKNTNAHSRIRRVVWRISASPKEYRRQKFCERTWRNSWWRRRPAFTRPGRLSPPISDVCKVSRSKWEQRPRDRRRPRPRFQPIFCWSSCKPRC